MASAALRTAVLVDSTKHHSVVPHLVLSSQSIDVLVTEESAAIDRWRAHQVDVMVPGPSA